MSRAAGQMSGSDDGLGAAEDLVREARLVVHALVQGSHDTRAELLAGAGSDLVERLVEGPGPAVGPVRRHRVERVGHRQDAGGERDLLTGEAVGVAAAVEALVMAA